MWMSISIPALIPQILGMSLPKSITLDTQWSFSLHNSCQGFPEVSLGWLHISLLGEAECQPQTQIFHCTSPPLERW